MGVSSLGKDHTWEINLAARAAWMSYIGDLTQSEIARRLGVSNARVYKLIQLARRQGIVRVSIEGRPAECLALEAELAARFDLKSCTISPYLGLSENNSHELVRAAVGQAAGQVIAQHLMLPSVRSVAVGMRGDCLRAAFTAMPQVPGRDLLVLAGQGGLSGELKATSHEIMMLLEHRTGAQVHPLPLPDTIKDAAQRDALLQIDAIANTLALAEQADLYVAEIQKGETEGTVRLFGGLLDLEGHIVESPEAQGCIGARLEPLAARIKSGTARSVLIAAIFEAPEVTLSVLRSGLVTDLVLYEAQAQAILAAVRENG